jgi:hypothetical protein
LIIQVECLAGDGVIWYDIFVQLFPVEIVRAQRCVGQEDQDRCCSSSIFFVFDRLGGCALPATAVLAALRIANVQDLYFTGEFQHLVPDPAGQKLHHISWDVSSFNTQAVHM